MKSLVRQFLAVFLFVCIPFSLSAAKNKNESAIKTSLNDSYKDLGVSIGVSLDSADVKQTENAYVVQVNFAEVTSRTELRADKILNVRPKRTVPFTASDGLTYNMPFQIDDAPIISALNKAKEMHVLLRLHPIIWHEHLPAWFFYEDFDLAKNFADKATMDARVEWYVNSFINSVRKWEKTNARAIQVVGAWHVASEIFNDNGKVREKSYWGEIYKDESYVLRAYKIVSERAKPEEKIVYSDSNLHLAKKRDAAIKLAGQIKKDGSRIDEISMISHLTADWPSRKDYFAAVKAFGKAGLSVQIAQLDIAPVDGKNVADSYYDFMTQVLDNRSIISEVSFRTVTQSSDRFYSDVMRSPILDVAFSPNDSYFSIIKAAEKYKK